MMSVHDGTFSLSLSELMAVRTIVGLSDENKAHSCSRKSQLDNYFITTSGKFAPIAKVLFLFNFVACALPMVGSILSLTISITASCLLATTGHKRHKKRKSSNSQQSSDLDRSDISDASDSELSEGEYSGLQSFGQNQITTHPRGGKELANQIRQGQIDRAHTRVQAQTARNSQSKRDELAKQIRDEQIARAHARIRAQSAHNSQSNRHRNHRNAPESSHQSESNCDSSGSVSDNNKENMTGRRQKAVANEARRLAEGGPTNANENNDPAAAETERLAAENSRLKNEVAALAKNTATFEPKTDEIASVARQVKNVIFTRYQFNINADDTRRIAAKIFMKLHDKPVRKDMGIEGKAQWIKTYTETVKSEMSGTRGYRCQELRKVCLDYAKEHGTLPSLAMMLKCMTGDIDLKDGEELDAYTWYWTKCMPVTVMASNWTAPIRNFTLMHQAKSRDDETVRFWP